MKSPGRPMILYPSMPKNPETATLNLSSRVFFCNSLACCSSTLAYSAFSQAISKYSSIFSRSPPCSTTICSISFITYRFFSIRAAISYTSQGRMRSWEERISLMMTDRTAIFDISSWEYDCDAPLLQGPLKCLPLPPLPISSFIFSLNSFQISLHLASISSICLLRREFSAHSLNCMAVQASPAALRSYSITILFTNGESVLRSYLYLALMA